MSTDDCFVGANREVKKAVEAYWAGKISADDLTKAASETKKASWTSVKSHSVDFIPRFDLFLWSLLTLRHILTNTLQFFVSWASSGDFSLYDHVLDHSAAFNIIPPRYQGQHLSALDIYFAMGRGRQADGVDVPASEMKKW